MGFLELAKERFSVRKFKEVPISQEYVDKIFEAGYIAPTACNRQPQLTESQIYFVLMTQIIKNRQISIVWSLSVLLFGFYNIISLILNINAQE